MILSLSRGQSWALWVHMYFLIKFRMVVFVLFFIFFCITCVSPSILRILVLKGIGDRFRISHNYLFSFPFLYLMLITSPYYDIFLVLLVVWSFFSGRWLWRGSLSSYIMIKVLPVFILWRSVLLDRKSLAYVSFLELSEIMLPCFPLL